ncbi:unnamed protein product [Schistosoma margrebowiei]|uniref:Uncharacterized protein n=1 Tax=Schistosoma margrebowiei TaxID=48269 RepID=A0A183M4U6_9TREM|nr:unnamed protein product [Schistosoma margrebowiei]
MFTFLGCSNYITLILNSSGSNQRMPMTSFSCTCSISRWIT